VRAGYAWAHRAAHILGLEGQAGAAIRARFGGLLGALSRYRGAAGGLSAGLAHFLRVSRSYWPGLFACYDTPGLPRTNNGLEQSFGSYRYHERRATGRKAASPALVLRGSARLVAALASRQRRYTAAELAQADRDSWRQLRGALDERRQRRVERGRFRRDPAGYLRRLEQRLTQPGLPS
jgi:hypothetical protein